MKSCSSQKVKNKKDTLAVTSEIFEFNVSKRVFTEKPSPDLAVAVPADIPAKEANVVSVYLRNG